MKKNEWLSVCNNRFDLMKGGSEQCIFYIFFPDRPKRTTELRYVSFQA